MTKLEFSAFFALTGIAERGILLLKRAVMRK